ncbi:hypothetical protein [Tunturiibacter lichenicola]|uniref:hypothetical protein n=1 Tax=Tunturiibacter lichenicola TaxID=2051959 RepID=UPI003D9BC5E7
MADCCTDIRTKLSDDNLTHTQSPLKENRTYTPRKPKTCVSDVTEPGWPPTAEGFADFLRESELTRYHEAGHAVAYYIYRFKPKRITGPLAEHDRRTTAFFSSRPGLLMTPVARERAQDYAVTVIAGIAAESKIADVPMAELRRTSGLDDYEIVYRVIDQLMYNQGFENKPDVFAARLNLLEARAVTMMNQPLVWSAVESVAEELLDSCGDLERGELVSAIERGLGL